MWVAYTLVRVCGPSGKPGSSYIRYYNLSSSQAISRSVATHNRSQCIHSLSSVVLIFDVKCPILSLWDVIPETE